ncbi:hypothetical protein VTO73DRAFT_5843 [Trametes versicolor]
MHRSSRLRRRVEGPVSTRCLPAGSLEDRMHRDPGPRASIHPIALLLPPSPSGAHPPPWTSYTYTRQPATGIGYVTHARWRQVQGQVQETGAVGLAEHSPTHTRFPPLPRWDPVSHIIRWRATLPPRPPTPALASTTPLAAAAYLPLTATRHRHCVIPSLLGCPYCSRPPLSRIRFAPGPCLPSQAGAGPCRSFLAVPSTRARALASIPAPALPPPTAKTEGCAASQGRRGSRAARRALRLLGQKGTPCAAALHGTPPLDISGDRARSGA